MRNLYGDNFVEVYTDKVKDQELQFFKFKVQASQKRASNAVQDAARKGAIAAVKAMKLEAPSVTHGDNTGRLRESIFFVSKDKKTPDLGRRAGGPGGGQTYSARVVAGVGVPYFKYVFEGTGLHGPKKQRIKPKTKKAMSFKSGYVGDLSDIRYQNKYQSNYQEINQARYKTNIGDPLKYNERGLGENSKYAGKAIAYSTRGQKPNQEFWKVGKKKAREAIRKRLQNF